MRFPVTYLQAIEEDLAFCGNQGPCDQIVECAFSGSVWPDETEQLSPLDGKAHITNSPQRAEPVADIVDCENCCHSLLFLLAMRVSAPAIPPGKYSITTISSTLYMTRCRPAA